MKYAALISIHLSIFEFSENVKAFTSTSNGVCRKQSLLPTLRNLDLRGYSNRYKGCEYKSPVADLLSLHQKKILCLGNFRLAVANNPEEFFEASPFSSSGILKRVDEEIPSRYDNSDCGNDDEKKQKPEINTNAEFDVPLEFLNDNINDVTKTIYNGGTSRRLFMASLIISSGLALNPTVSTAAKLQWQTSPINKRTGITVFQAEQNGYNVRFITYLSRFLLSFDDECQRWWYTRAGDIPRFSTAEQVDMMRLKQFGAFSASVEIGLQEYLGPGGPKRLMTSLLYRYCPDFETLKKGRELMGKPPLKPLEEDRTKREIKEARRQIALLFGLLQQFQPVEEITQLLAAIDNASVQNVIVSDPGSGYAPGYGPPAVLFPPPDAGDGYERATGFAVLKPNGKILRIDIEKRGKGFKTPPAVVVSPPDAASELKNINATAATAKAFIFRDGVNKGRLERIQLLNPGSGYTENDRIVVKLTHPEMEGGLKATAKAQLEYDVSEIKIQNPGSGYAAEKPIQVYVDPPPLTARINMNDPMMAGVVSPNEPLPLTTIPSPKMVSGMPNMNDPNSISARVWKDAKVGGGGGCIGRACYDRKVLATAYPKAERDSYLSYRNEDDFVKMETVETAVMKRSANSNSSARAAAAKKRSQEVSGLVSGTTSGNDNSLPTLPFWSGGPSSSTELLSLLPSGVGLEYNDVLKRYELAIAENQLENMGWSKSGSGGKPIDPEFGPRGRSPIERERNLDANTLFRFWASGAICSSSVHLALTPIDVIKTKVQTDANKYPDVFSAFRIVVSEQGLGTFFTGWQPTFVGFFIYGGISYASTEFFRRYFTDIVGGIASNYEVPIILAAAATSAFFGSLTLAPSESVRIRSVAQPDYAPNIIGVLNRMVEEEGALSLFNSVPAFLLKEIPFSMAKFTVFDISTAYMYEMFPAAREDLQLSLVVSLIGGTLGGICAAIVSNPADATISAMKKSKTDLGPFGTAKLLFEDGGIPALFRGLGLRMFFYSLIVSLQFLVYDAVRFSLGIGSDDMKLYLDVLGGALKESGGPV